MRLRTIADVCKIHGFLVPNHFLAFGDVFLLQVSGSSSSTQKIPALKPSVIVGRSNCLMQRKQQQ
jgi:hypothetical protein